MKVANVSPTFRDPKTFDHCQPPTARLLGRAGNGR